MIFTIDHCLQSLLETSIKKTLKPEFMTSLEVIKRVMNVPECALEALLRENGYDAIETTSICIDEEMLLVFANAYIRKLRSYFISSNRNIHLLTPQERFDLDEFYTVFKKKGVEHTNVKNWNQIDTELIRDHFVQEVKKQTPHRNSFYDDIICHVVINKTNEELSRDKIYLIAENSQHKHVHSRNYKSELLVRITKSRLYQAKLRANNSINPTSTTTLRQIYTVARYHTFPVDSNNPDDDNNKTFVFCDIYNDTLTASSGAPTIHIPMVHKQRI
ncbi:MAG: hypothetical protein IKJ95_01320 [Bacteroidaceae bacterium]|nr:hypothetical protein [Bacteroidaceae bacterium]